MDRNSVEPEQELVCSVRRARVAPREELRQRAAVAIEREQAVAEARRADCIDTTGTAGVVDRPSRQGNDPVGVGLRGVVVLDELLVFPRRLVESVRANGGRTDVERENVGPGHRADDSGALADGT
jgi:hypothetical protein